MKRRRPIPMARSLGGCFGGCFIGFALFAVVCAFLLGSVLLSDGDILRVAHRLSTRIQLQARADELHAPVSDDATEIRFDIVPGSGAADIAADLLAANLIRDAGLFVDFAVSQDLDRRFRAGIYFLNQTQSIVDIAQALTDAGASGISFRVLEGMRIEEVAAAVEQTGRFGFGGGDFLAVVGAGSALPVEFAAWAGIPAGASLEGFVFPDSYVLSPAIDAVGLRDALLRNFRERVGDELRAEAEAQGFSLYEMVALASIIEREAVWRDEHAMISSVYRNRLAIGMKLEADPTVQYGLGGTRGGWWPQITRADYQGAISPYNTYRVDGLPGPIANPSLSAIQAAINPAESPYYYFRAACDGSHRHNFAVTFAEHVANGC